MTNTATGSVEQTGRNRRAIVMGRSVAGLAASRVLSDHFREVVVVECCAFPRIKEKSNMKEANTVIGSEPAAVGLRGKSALPGSDELTMTDMPQQILRSVLAALSEGRVSEAVEQFADRFTFNDHALRLEFTDKPSLTEFFEKSRELFPDATLEIGSLFESGDHAIAEWRFSATESVTLVSVSHRIPFSLQGSTIACIENRRIVRWSQYYDPSSSLPISLSAFFTKMD